MSVSVLSTVVNVLISEPFVSCVSVVELKVDVALLLSPPSIMGLLL